MKLVAVVGYQQGRYVFFRTDAGLYAGVSITRPAVILHKYLEHINRGADYIEGVDGLEESDIKKAEKLFYAGEVLSSDDDFKKGAAWFPKEIAV